VKVVQQIDEVFVAVVLARHAERLIETAAHGVANDRQESEGANVGGLIGPPHAPNEILIAEEELGGDTGHILTGRFQVFSKNEGVQLGHGAQQLDGGVCIAGIPHVLETNDPFVTGIRF